jgi:hypothetical protein
VHQIEDESLGKTGVLLIMGLYDSKITLIEETGDGPCDVTIAWSWR